jgi:transposase InsO family protein
MKGRGCHRSGPRLAGLGPEPGEGHPPDNGSSYISADLAKWLDGQNMEHVGGAPYHPMPQGKIERGHQTLKNSILLENYYLPSDLEPRSRPSSLTTITCDITRASAT